MKTASELLAKADGLLKGDLPGHPFRGNQWTGGGSKVPSSVREKYESNSRKVAIQSKESKEKIESAKRNVRDGSGLALDAAAVARDESLERQAKFNLLLGNAVSMIQKASDELRGQEKNVPEAIKLPYSKIHKSLFSISLSLQTRIGKYSDEAIFKSVGKEVAAYAKMVDKKLAALDILTK